MTAPVLLHRTRYHAPMSPRSTRLAVVAALYTAIVAGLFVALFDRPGSDDYAGWAPTIAALGVPACLVIAFAQGRLGWLAALSLGVPAALSLGGVTMLMAWPVLTLYRPTNDMAALLLLLLLGPCAVTTMAFLICRRLHGLPVRTGARRIVVVVAASGALALVASAAAWWGFWNLDDGSAQSAAVLFFLFGALPLGWTLGPTLTLLATANPADPDAAPVY